MKVSSVLFLMQRPGLDFRLGSLCLSPRGAHVTPPPPHLASSNTGVSNQNKHWAKMENLSQANIDISWKKNLSSRCHSDKFCFTLNMAQEKLDAIQKMTSNDPHRKLNFKFKQNLETNSMLIKVVLLSFTCSFLNQIPAVTLFLHLKIK